MAVDASEYFQPQDYVTKKKQKGLFDDMVPPIEHDTLLQETEASPNVYKGPSSSIRKEELPLEDQEALKDTKFVSPPTPRTEYITNEGSTNKITYSGELETPEGETVPYEAPFQYPSSQEIDSKTVDVKGDIKDKENLIPPSEVQAKPTDTNPENKTEEKKFEWGPVVGRLLAGFTPMALETLFGGGKHYGAAAKGGLGGLQMYDTLDKTAFDQDFKNKQLQMQQQKMNAPKAGSFEPVDVMQKGEARKGAFNRQTGGITLTDFAPIPKANEAAGTKPKIQSVTGKLDGQGPDRPFTVVMTPEGQKILDGQKDVTGRVQITNTRADIGAQYLELAKERENRAQRENAARGGVKISDALNFSKDYVEKYRALDSFGPKYAKMADTSLPPHLQAERQGVRRMISGYIRDNAGTAQGQHEIVQIMAGLGITDTSKSLADAMTNPELWADRLVTSTSADNLRQGLDAIARNQLSKRSEVLAPYEKNPSVMEQVAPKIPSFELRPYTPASSTMTPTQKLIEQARRKRGLQ